MYEPQFVAAILSPANSLDYNEAERSPLFRYEDDTSDVEIIVGTNEDADNIKLFLNNTQIASIQNSDTLAYNLDPTNLLGGINYIHAIADKGGEYDTTDAVCIAVHAANEGVRPDNVNDGITIDGSSISFSLFAPYKNFVYLLGDFNDWKVDAAYQMKKDVHSADSTVFWITLIGLPDSLMGFQYFVDGEIRIADAYSELILDPWNDQYISSTVYPNLKHYPSGKTDFPVGVVDPTPPVFNWTDSEYEKPDKDDLIIYEVLIRDWDYAHSYQTLINRIDYFITLGITAIELMPVCEFEGNESWGYNPSFYFALDKYYGTATKFKEFVNLCHENGIAVILDVVYNHATGQNPMVRLYNEGTYGAPTSANPWFNTVAKHPYNVFNDANHESIHTKHVLDRVNRFWIEEYHVDGYRFDLSKGFTQTNSGSNVAYWGNYDASRVAILKRMADKIWEVDPNAYIILEHFSDNSEEIDLSNYGMMLWGNGNHNYCEASMGYLGSSDLSGVNSASRGWSWRHLVGYMESHDEERMMYRNKEYGNSSGTYLIKLEDTGLDRVELAAVFFLSIPGPKMIWQFGELGYSYSIDYNGRTGKKPIKWDYYDDPDRHDVYDLFSVMNFLRANYTVFGAASGVDLDVGNNVATKRIKLSADINAVILGNFDVVEQTATPAFHHSGIWYEYFRDDTLIVTNTNEGILLAPGEYRIYTDQKLLESPVSLENVLPRSFALKQNYPNPFNPNTSIDYVITSDSDVNVSIFDISGRKIATLVNGYQSAGEYSLLFDASKLASGVYMYKLTSGRHQETRKMLLLK
jgi:glycosidase